MLFLSPPDFCYGNEDLAFSISEAIKLCVTVVAYAPESFRRYGDALCFVLTPFPLCVYISPCLCVLSLSPVSRC